MPYPILRAKNVLDVDNDQTLIITTEFIHSFNIIRRARNEHRPVTESQRHARTTRRYNSALPIVRATSLAQHLEHTRPNDAGQNVATSAIVCYQLTDGGGNVAVWERLRRCLSCLLVRRYLRTFFDAFLGEGRGEGRLGFVLDRSSL